MTKFSKKKNKFAKETISPDFSKNQKNQTFLKKIKMFTSPKNKLGHSFRKNRNFSKFSNSQKSIRPEFSKRSKFTKCSKVPNPQKSINPEFSKIYNFQNQKFQIPKIS